MTARGRIVRGALQVAVALALLLAPSLAAAERVGVVVAVAVNLEERKVQKLAARLGQALRQRLQVDVIAGPEAARRLPPGGMSDTCVADAACLRELGKRLGADQLLLLAVVRVGERVQIDPTWVDAATGETVARERVVIEGAGAPVEDIFRDAAPMLLPAAAHRPAPGQGGSPAQQAPGQMHIEATPREPRGRRMTTGAWIAGSASATALVASGLLALDAYRKYDALEQMGCDRMACDSGSIDAVDTRALAADVLLGVGVVAGASAILLYYTSGERAPAERVALAPAIGVGAAQGTLTVTLGGWF